MAKFSGGEAIGAGFRVIGRHPGAILIWAVVYLVLGILPKVAMFGMIAPDFWETIKQATANGAAGGGPGDAAFANMWRMQSHLMAYNGVSLLTTLLLHGVLAAAVFRAVLEDKNSGFGYLRLGAQEFWIVVVSVAFWVLLFLVMLVALIPMVVLAVAVGAAAGHGDASGGPAGGVGAIALIGLCVAALVLIVWLCLRFSMALPMTFAKRQFMLFESWSLTRGQAWRLFGVALALVALIIVLEIVVLGVVFAAAGGTLMAHMADFQAFAKRPPADWIAAATPWLIGYCGIVSIAGAAFYAIMLAPWASIYGQLTARSQARAMFDED